MLCKGLQILVAYTVHTPAGIDKIYPFLVAIIAGRTVKEVIGFGLGLFQKENEVVFHGSFLIYIETKLLVYCFELAACFIHAFVLFWFLLAVQRITRDFLETVSFVFGAHRESFPKSLTGMELKALTKISTLERQLATGS